MAPIKTTAKTVDATQPAKRAVEKSTKVQYRVLRPIRHGKIDILANDLVTMYPEDAQHLVETKALAPHVVTEQVSRVFDLPATPRPQPDTDGVGVSAARSEVTGVEVAGQLAAPGAAAPDATAPIAEVNSTGDVVLT